MARNKSVIQTIWKYIWNPGRFCVYIALFLALFIDRLAQPLWPISLFPWPQIIISSLLLLFFYTEYYRALPHHISTRFVVPAYIVTFIALYQFLAVLIAGLPTIGQTPDLLGVSPQPVADVVLAWLLPTLTLSVATCDVTYKILTPMRSPETTRKIARRAIWFIPAILLSCLPAIFPSGYSFVTPPPVRELALYVIVSLASFVWLVELPGYISIARAKRYLTKKLWTLESTFDNLAQFPNYNRALEALLASEFRIVPNLLAPKTESNLALFPKRYSRQIRNLSLGSSFVKKWLEALRKELTFLPGRITEFLQDTALLSIYDVKSVLDQVDIIIHLDIEEIVCTVEGWDLEFRTGWQERISSRINMLTSGGNIRIDSTMRKWLRNLLIVLCREWETWIVRVLLSYVLTDPEERHLASRESLERVRKDYFLINSRRLKWDDCLDKDLSQQQIWFLVVFAGFWLDAAFDARQWYYRYYRFAKVGLPRGTALSGEFNANDYGWVVQLVQKEHERIQRESSHPFPELAALASIAGVGTLIAIALRFI